MASDRKTPITIGPGGAGAGGVAVDIQIDPRDLARLKTELASIKNGVPRAIAGAVNKTLKRGQTVLVDKLFEVLNVRVRRSILGETGHRRITITPAKVPDKLFGSINVLRRRIALANFNPRDTRIKRPGVKYGTPGTGQGVFAAAYRGGGEEQFPRAFVAVGKSSNKHVFERGGGRSRREGSIFVPGPDLPGTGRRRGRLPIFSRKGLSLLDVYQQNPAVYEAVVARIREVLGEQLLSQTDRLLNRRKADRPT